MTVEQHLFGDIRQMLETSVGFPLMLAAFSGAELFGALLSGTHFNAGIGDKYFTSFWKDHLYPTAPVPEHTARLVYDVARNGLAHIYLLKGPVVVVRDRESCHLTMNQDGCLVLDAGRLARDLIDAYQARVRPIVSRSAGSPNGKTMGDRLAEIRKIYTKQGTSVVSVSSQFPTSTLDSAPISRCFWPPNSTVR